MTNDPYKQIRNIFSYIEWSDGTVMLIKPDGAMTDVFTTHIDHSPSWGATIRHLRQMFAYDIDELQEDTPGTYGIMMHPQWAPLQADASRMFAYNHAQNMLGELNR